MGCTRTYLVATQQKRPFQSAPTKYVLCKNDKTITLIHFICTHDVARKNTFFFKQTILAFFLISSVLLSYCGEMRKDFISLTLVMLNKLSSSFQPIKLLDPSCWYKWMTNWMTNSTDPDQLASSEALWSGSEADWSGSTLFAKAGYIPVQQDEG